MKVSVLGPVTTQVKMGKKGEYTVHSQEVTVETPQLRMTFDMDVETPAKGYQPGIAHTCDIESQLKPGRYGLELPRYLKLTPAK